MIAPPRPTGASDIREERYMGMDPGFWAAIIIFASLGVLMNVIWIVAHRREKKAK
ncbi:MAG: hypothetical protein V3S98_02665 [Dehalococcoidia bacterium]